MTPEKAESAVHTFASMAGHLHRDAIMNTFAVAIDEHLKYELERALQGLDYPAPRNKLLTVAYQNGVSEEAANLLLALPETADFINEEELRQVFGIHVPGTHPHGWE